MTPVLDKVRAVHSLRPLVTTICSVVLLGGCAWLKPHLAPKDAPWRELTSPHFVVWTDLQGEDAIRTVERLELHRKLILFAASESTDPPGKLHVILPARADYLDTRFPQGTDLAFDSGPRPSTIFSADLFNVDAPELPNHVAIRYAALLTHGTLARAPRWFAAGWAIYLQGIVVQDDYGRALIGYPLAALEPYKARFAGDYTLPFEKGPVPVRALWESEVRPPGGWFFVRAYEWIYFLRSRHPARLAQYLDRLTRGEDPQAAWMRTFSDLGDDALLEQLRAFLSTNERYAYQQVPIPKVAVPIAARPLDDVEQVLLAARLEWQLSTKPTLERRAPAIARLQQAIAATPGDARLWRMLAELDRTALTPGTARTLLAENPRDAEAALALALALLAEPDANPERRQALESAVRLTPSDPVAMMLLAREYTLANQPQEALVRATTAARLAPWSAEVAAIHAYAAAFAGRCSDAVVLYRRQRELAETYEQFNAAQEHLAQAQKGCAAVQPPSLAELGM